MDAEWIEWLIKLGAIAGAVTVVGKLLVGIYESTVTRPITRNLKPLVKAIDELNKLLKESEEINTTQNARLDNHEWRICVLEKFKDKHKDEHKRGK